MQQKIDQRLLMKLIEPTEVIPIVTTMAVEDFHKLANSQKLKQIIVPFKEPYYGYYVAPDNTEKRVCLVHTEYLMTVYKSTVRETFGHPTIGCSAITHGYLVAVDGEQRPLTEEIPNPLAGQEGQPDFFTIEKLIKSDESGDLEPIECHVFRLQYGSNRSKKVHSRLRYADQLNLIPNRGVPRKDTNTKQAQEEDEVVVVDDKTAQTYSDTIDWAKIPNLEPMLIKPMLNAALQLELDPNNAEALEMKEFCENIPIAHNAPSRRQTKQDGSFSTPVATAAGEAPADPFAAAPTAEEAKSEPSEDGKTTEAEAEKPKRGRRAATEAEA